MSICGGNVIAPDVDAARARRARPGAARASSSTTLFDELVVDRLLDVDPLHRHADLAAVGHRPLHGHVGRALEVGVAQHDHRVLAAQLERHRDQPLGRARQRPSCRSRVEPVNMIMSTLSTSAAPVSPRAGGDQEDVRRARRTAREPSPSAAIVSGVTSLGFSTTAVAGHQRRDRSRRSCWSAGSSRGRSRRPRRSGR